MNQNPNGISLCSTTNSAVFFDYCQFCCTFAGKMVSTSDILSYAATHDVISSKEIAAYFRKIGKDTTLKSIGARLSALKRDGVLKKVGYGVYILSENSNKPFVPEFTAEMMILYNTIKNKMPLAEFCIWDIADLKRLAHHVANLDIIFIDVERDCMESAFNAINSFDIKRNIYLTPKEDIYERYIVGKPSLVIRPLVSEAPIAESMTGEKTAAIEKILVDAAIDYDFFAFQGGQIYDIYMTAFDRYRINTAKMLRYAARRTAQSKISEILTELNIHTK